MVIFHQLKPSNILLEDSARTLEIGTVRHCSLYLWHMLQRCTIWRVRFIDWYAMVWKRTKCHLEFIYNACVLLETCSRRRGNWWMFPLGVKVKQPDRHATYVIMGYQPVYWTQPTSICMNAYIIQLQWVSIPPRHLFFPLFFFFMRQPNWFIFMLLHIKFCGAQAVMI